MSARLELARTRQMGSKDKEGRRQSRWKNENQKVKKGKTKKERWRRRKTV